MTRMPPRDPMRPPTPVLVFDIETVPDVQLLMDIYEPQLSFTPEPSTVWRDLRIVDQINLERPKFFPPPLFHTVISISAIFVSPDTHGIIDGFRKTVRDPLNAADLRTGERTLLQEFWGFANKYRDIGRQWYDSLQSDFRMSEYQKNKLRPVPLVFCGFNVSGFDLPVIEQRSVRHLLACPVQEYAAEDGPGSYRYKYGSDRVFDLLDYLSNHQQHCRMKLDAISRAIGLGGKMEGMDGSLVADQYFNKGNFQAIEEYCAVDVLITYGVYLAVQKYRNVLSESQFKDCALDFHRFLTRDGKPEVYHELARHSAEFWRNAGLSAAELV